VVLPLIGNINAVTLDYIILPFYNRGNLADYVKEMDIYSKTVEERIALAKTIAQYIVPALIGIHTAGYLHLDISFSNILVHYQKGKLAVALTDVGIARKEQDFLSKWTTTNDIVKAGSGTPFESVYIALGIPPTKNSDFESLGYVLYGLVYGELPWQNKTNIKAIRLKRELDTKFLHNYFKILRKGNKHYKLINSI